MTYNIRKTNGDTLPPLADGTSDATSTSLVLFGKNYAGYGPLMNENLVRILENFSYTQAPNSPLTGQLWWDSNARLLKIRRNNDWKTLAPVAAPVAPSTDTAGDLWWDTINYQLKVSDGVDWTTVGPAFTADQGVTGATSATLPESSSAATHTAVLFKVGGVTQAVLSGDATYNTSAVPGFSTIRKGLNILPSAQYYGDANNALSLGSVNAANYLRSDINGVTDGTFKVNNNGGLTVGTANALTVKIVGNNANLTNTIDNGDLNLYTTQAGLPVLTLTANSSTGLVSVRANPTDALGVATKQYVDSTVSSSAITKLNKDGSTPLSGDLVSASPGLISLGSNTNRFATVYASNVNASNVTSVTGIFDSVEVNQVPPTNSSATAKFYVDTSSASAVASANSNTDAKVANLVDGAPANLNTLNKIATAINNDPAFTTTVNAAVALKAPIASPAFTGIPVAPTAAPGTNNFQLATTAFVKNALTNVSLPGVTAASTILIDNGLQVNGGDITTTTNNAVNIGSASNRFRTLYATGLDVTGPSTLQNLVVQGTLTGNASTATKLAASRTLSLAGDVTGSASFDGSANIVITATVADNSHSHVSANISDATSANTPTTIVKRDASGNFSAGVITATATSALYADLAENYVADRQYEPGTVLEFGGEHEVTQSTSIGSTRVAGVVSSMPAYLMNSTCEGEFVVAIALQGRCPVKVHGPVKKGDCLVSGVNGFAVVINSAKAGTIIGKALSNFDADSGVVEVSVGRC